MVVVRKLPESAADELASIDRFCNRPPWSSTLFAGEFHLAISAIYGAYQENSIVGFLVRHIIFDELHIVSLGVREEFRRQGVGRELVKFVMDEARQEYIPWVTLEVRPSNIAARRLYESFGFIQQGMRPRYYSDNSEDALILTASSSSVTD